MGYLEACESGSIFNNLLKAPNAKAVTAANAKESSWGWYCAGSGTGGDMVNGKAIKSCLGDEFSVRWMEDTEAASITSETVGQQVTWVVAAVTKSHVQQYGVTSFDSEPIGDFQGNNNAMDVHAVSRSASEGNGVDSRQVEVHQAYYKVLRAQTPQERKLAEEELASVLSRRRAADVKFGAIASTVAHGNETLAQEMLEGDISFFDAACHQAMIRKAVDHCGSFTDYSLRYSRLFANLCASNAKKEDVILSIRTVCGAELVV